MKPPRKVARPARKEPDAKVRRKPDVSRKESSIRLRCTDEQKRILTAAADREGLDVSSWLRTLGMARARELGVA